MSQALLSLTNVGKDYAKVASAGGRVRLVYDLLRGRGAAHVFRALDNVNFELRRGESLGIIGENGAGKSTLLKIVAGVIQPTRGQVHLRGRVGALLELGSGFHPEYTGDANIDLAGALLGLSPAEIARKRAEIIAFADLGEHLQDPIKHYSSGMVVRLGFAVATALAPEILITDEVLAVGDESFQKKCIAWMEQFLESAGTLLLCSHSMYHVQKLCRHALWLKDGKMQRYGPAAEVTQAYLAYHEEKGQQRKTPIPVAAAWVAGVYAVQRFVMEPGDTLEQGSDLALYAEIFSPDDRSPALAIGIVRVDGTAVFGVTTDMDQVAPQRVAAHRYSYAVRFPKLLLLPGKYFVRAHALDPEGLRLFDAVELTLTVTGPSRELGLVHLPHRWTRD